PQARCQCARARCVARASRAERRAAVGARLDHRQPARRVRLLDHRRNRRRVPGSAKGARPRHLQLAEQLQPGRCLRGDGDHRRRRTLGRSADRPARASLARVAPAGSHRSRVHLMPVRPHSKEGLRMLRRTIKLALTAGALAAAVTAGFAYAGTSKHHDLPTVTLMVGGIDKQIYLPYQLAQDLGFYKKYGVNVQLSTEQNGGVGAETAMVSGQVDMAGAWYVHAIDFQAKGKDVVDVVQLSWAPGE